MRWTDLSRYFATRILRWRIALLWALLVTASVAAEDADAISAFLPRAGLGALLIIQFRLWDDLADREHDAIHHPQRVLPNCGDPRLFRIVLLGSIILAACALGASGNMRTVVLYGVLILFLATVYAYGRPGRAYRIQGVLLKYPAFVFLLSPDAANARVAWCAAALYCLISIHEWFGKRLHQVAVNACARLRR